MEQILTADMNLTYTTADSRLYYKLGLLQIDTDLFTTDSKSECTELTPYIRPTILVMT